METSLGEALGAHSLNIKKQNQSVTQFSKLAVFTWGL